MHGHVPPCPLAAVNMVPLTTMVILLHLFPYPVVHHPWLLYAVGGMVMHGVWRVVHHPWLLYAVGVMVMHGVWRVVHHPWLL